MSDNNKQCGLRGRIIIKGIIHCATGLHIGGGKDNMAIGVVDMTVVRDPMTRRPIIPGSSIKGKLRTLLAKASVKPEDPFLPEHKKDTDQIKHLFGSSEKPVIQSRLQFTDAHMTDNSKEKLEKADTALFLTEVKYENTINRLTSVATPRQIERVPAGAEFDFTLTYLMEEGESDEEMKKEILDDLKLLAEGLQILQQDYLGGHGSRGSGRICFRGLQPDMKTYDNKKSPIPMEEVITVFKDVESAAIFELIGV